MMKTNARVAVLMTTYNGERYIRQQLESLQNQTYGDWELFVRDDLSDDQTPQILQQFATNDPRIHIIQDSTKRGARDGFMHLLEQVDAELYMFSDHDDVWLPDKIKKSIQKYDSLNLNDAPVIVATDYKLVDEHLHVICESYWDARRFPTSWFNDKYYHLFYDNIIGCAMLFNQKAKEVSLPYNPLTTMHDLWVIASVLWRGGKVFCIHEPHLLYRQHAHNVIGVRDIPSIWQQLRSSLRLFRKTKTQYRASQTLTSMSFITFLLSKCYYSLRTHFLPKI